MNNLMNRKYCIRVLIFVFFCTCLRGYTLAQDFSMDAPSLAAELSVGFNSDFLKDPLNVSYDYPKGYFGFNVPLSYSMNKNIVESITSGLDSTFNDDFTPSAELRQAVNTSVKVDVPMFGGVGTFSNIQNMYLSYKNTLGAAIDMDSTMESSGQETSIITTGLVSVPLNMSMGWETMTFGYAYMFNDRLSMAVNLHRHLFDFNLRGRVDVDLLGKVSAEIEGAKTDIPINYSLNNVIKGHYSLTTLTPTFAVKYWRVGLISRFGMKKKATGSLEANYSVPFFIDKHSFEMDELEDTEYLSDNIDNFISSKKSRVDYSTDENSTLDWEMPYSLTLNFDIVPEKLYFSYSKLFGRLHMGLTSSVNEETNDTLDFRFSADIDHFMMLYGEFYHWSFNLGIFSMDFAYNENKDLLSGVKGLVEFGDGVMMPVLSLGGRVGSKLQLGVELDILPVTALKTGVIYYF